MEHPSSDAWYASFRHRTIPVYQKANPHHLKWFPVLLAVLTGALYLPGQFVYDDHQAIVNNPVMHTDVPFSAVWTTDIWGTPLNEAVRGYRPLTNLFWKGIWTLTPAQPLVFRLITLLLHAFATLAVTRIATELTQKTFPGIATGLLFAIHPIHSEALGGVSWQSDVLSACLGFWALFLAMAPRSLRTTGAMACLLFVSVLTKESGFLFCLVVSGMALTRPDGIRRNAHLLWIALPLAVGAILLQMNLDRSAGESGSNNLWYGASMGERIPLGLALIGKGTRLLMAPTGLTPSHGYAHTTLNTVSLLPDACLGAFACLTSVVLAWRSRNQGRPGTWIATALWMGPLVLQSGLIVPIQTDFAERLLYPSAFASTLALSLFLARIQGSLKTMLVCGLVMLSLGAQASSANAWRSDVNLWTRAMQVAPGAIRTQENFGILEMSAKRIDSGAWHFLVGTHLRRQFPQGVEWERIEEIGKRFEGRERVLRGIGILTYPAPPCGLWSDFLVRMDAMIPGFSARANPDFQRAYPVCADPSGQLE